MEQNTEELRLLLELATNKGREEQKNCQLTNEVEQLKQALDLLKKQLDEANDLIAKQNDLIAQQTEQIKKLEYLVSCNGVGSDCQSAQQVVLVNQYIVLSTPKMGDYVKSLDDDHRIFAGHLLIHSMPDGVSPLLIKKVTEMTQLEGCQRQQKLADSLEKIANKPTNQKTLSLEFVQRKETNIDTNYGPNIENNNYEG